MLSVRADSEGLAGPMRLPSCLPALSEKIRQLVVDFQARIVEKYGGEVESEETEGVTKENPFDNLPDFVKPRGAKFR
jgi:hypothetical protein